MNRIRQLRNTAEMKQADLASRLNVRPNTISNWETEKTEPDFDSLQKMAVIFNTSVDYLIGHTDERRRIERTEVYQLNADEAAIITRYRCLHENEKNCIRLTMDAFIGSN